MRITIALDGPVGAGKSSIADLVAKRLDILHLDTGAMSRAIGLYARRHGGAEDEDRVVGMLGDIQVRVTYRDGAQQTWLGDEDVTGLIRTQEVSMAASCVSRYRKVREKMVALQRELSRETSMIVDGRDIGTKVLVDAPVKIFLTAAAEERARRRYRELIEKGMSADYEQVLLELKQRDEQDSTREVDPLRCADDAIVVDTTHLDIQQTVDRILELTEAVYGQKNE